MEIVPINISFSEDADQEVRTFLGDLQLWNILTAIHSQTEITEELKDNVQKAVTLLGNLFSTDLPEVSKDPEITMKLASREINLGNLLVERGIFRVYQLINQRVWVDEEGNFIEPQPTDPELAFAEGLASLPVFRLMENPLLEGDRPRPFRSQEEFIIWFCEEARISRGTLYSRFSSIKRLQSLGFDLNETFKTIIAKPFAVHQTLSMLATWDKNRGDITDIDPELAVKLTERVNPWDLEEVKELAERLKEDPDDEDAMGELIQHMKPSIASLVREVSDHDNAGDALDFVRHDVLDKPEIRYVYDEDTDIITVIAIRRAVDEKGETYTIGRDEIRFIPEVTNRLPPLIREDLLRRLPVHIKDKF
jgi:hypothetical protein